jgi:hypothetical protein
LQRLAVRIGTTGILSYNGQNVMPLRAIVDGKQVVAPLLTSDEWSELKNAVQSGQKSVVMPCCGGSGHLRMSKRGLKHFAHNPGAQRTAACEIHETKEHLLAKAEIAIACKEAGYVPVTEAAELDWRADVLATRGNNRIAFEVQWSQQTLEETLKRQERYRKAGIRCCWLFRNPPPQFEHAAELLPLFPLRVSEPDKFVVELNPPDFWQYPASHKPRELPLHKLIHALLAGHIRFCEQLRTTHLNARIVFLEMECWSCHRIFHVYYVDENSVKSDCGLLIDPNRDSFSEAKRIEFRSEIESAVRQYIKGNPEKALKVGTIGPRLNRTAGRTFMTFGCAWCDAIVGRNYWIDAMLDDIESDNSIAQFETLVHLKTPLQEQLPHWCYSPDSHFCEG